MKREQQLRVSAWGLSSLVVVVAFVAWGQSFRWRFTHLSSYQLFPVFGLLAFSLMWSHYIAAVLRMYLQFDKAVLHRYFEVTSLAVLALILAHPGLLAWQLWRDGLGLPPGSELLYGGTMRGAVLLGMIAWLVFLAYEFRRKFENRPWWQIVSIATDAAMVLIFIHSLRLGSQLQAGWFRTLWYFYGVTLAASLVYIYAKKFQPSASAIAK
jgi:hypothetical protein